MVLTPFTTVSRFLYRFGRFQGFPARAAGVDQGKLPGKVSKSLQDGRKYWSGIDLQGTYCEAVRWVWEACTETYIYTKARPPWSNRARVYGLWF